MYTLNKCSNSEDLIHSLFIYPSETRDMSITMIRLLMRSIKVLAPMLLLLAYILPLISPRIPPFVGYFFCQASHHGTGCGHDICGLNEDDIITSILSSLRIDLVSLNIVRLLGLMVSILLLTPPVWSAVVALIYEILPSLLFQRQCLQRLNERARICGPKEYMQTLRKYKELQILNIMFNEIFQRDHFVIGCGIILLICIATGFVLLTMYNVHFMVLFIASYILVTEYIVLLTMFTMASRVWSNSEQFKLTCRQNSRLNRIRLLRKHTKCLQNLKIKIGDSNFVEKNTPFMYISCCIEQTVSLVLLRKQT
jgi:hypothetical protein